MSAGYLLQSTGKRRGAVEVRSLIRMIKGEERWRRRRATRGDMWKLIKRRRWPLARKRRRHHAARSRPAGSVAEFVAGAPGGLCSARARSLPTGRNGYHSTDYCAIATVKLPDQPVSWKCGKTRRTGIYRRQPAGKQAIPFELSAGYQRADHRLVACRANTVFAAELGFPRGRL